ncbi:MAG: hypothetical protein IPM56_17935 [Ignavibacteriales bacterium]|nr:MAG: hypothetical protein IPM56_17935 [Ignavibacteriales bacterium]
MKPIYFLILPLLILYCGCAGSGFDQGLINKKLSYDVITNDADIQKVLTLKPQLTAPLRLAVYLDQQVVNYWQNTYWRWVENDKAKILDTLKSIDDSLFSEIFIIPSSMVGDSNIKTIRLAAARHNADAVLVIRGINDIDKYGNFWSWTYITIILGWIVPGTEVDSYFKLSASMWDVRNEYLYLTAESDSYSNYSKAAFIINDKNIVNKDKTVAFNSILKELKSRFKNLYKE